MAKDLLKSRFSKWAIGAGILGVIVSSGCAQTIYPDGGRNVIKIQAKPTRIIPYNDGSIMTHIIGSAGMNFLYYFYILGVSCENNDPEFYKSIQMDYEFCLNKTGPLPNNVRDRPLGSVPKSCYDWKIHRPCYKNLAQDYDECLAGRPGLVKKGTDALRFTHAYYLFICGNIADTEAHLLDRYTKHDLLVFGVFQCFPKLQDRINNCVKRDKVSKTLCSKFYIVHACFGKYYNDDNCQDEQPIYYMDDMFRNMSKSLNCKDDNIWVRPPDGGWTPSPSPTPGGWSKTPGWSSRPPQNKGWPSTSPTPGWSKTPSYAPPVNNGWSSSEEQFGRGKGNNIWPGKVGRPWSSERGREPFVRGDGYKTPSQQQLGHHHHHHHHNHHHHPNSNDRIYDSVESGERRQGKERDRLIDPHANRPLPDSSWSRKPAWMDILTTGRGRPSSLGPPFDRERGRNPNSIDSSRGTGLGRGSGGVYLTRGPSRDSFPSSTPRGQVFGGRGGGRYNKISLPPAGYAVTRVPEEATETDQDRYYTTRDSPDIDVKMEGGGGDEDDEDSQDINFFQFE